MPADVGRRSLLQTGGGAGALMALGSASSAHAAAELDRSYRFFEPAEARFIESAVDRLIPAEPESPGALLAGVAIYIDHQLDGPFGKGERLYLAEPIRAGTPQQGYQLGLTPAALYRRFLAAIARDADAGGRDFADADGETRDAYLRRLEAGELVDDGVSSAVFFETLLANTVEGFFCDPAYGGNRDMAGWRMIGFPGAYAAYLGIYTQHGIAFKREPVGMTGRGSHGHAGRHHHR